MTIETRIAAYKAAMPAHEAWERVMRAAYAYLEMVGGDPSDDDTRADLEKTEAACEVLLDLPSAPAMPMFLSQCKPRRR